MTDEPNGPPPLQGYVDPVRTARESAWKVRCAADIARALTMRDGSHQYTAEKIAERASDISEHLWKQACSRGWTY